MARTDIKDGMNGEIEGLRTVAIDDKYRESLFKRFSGQLNDNFQGAEINMQIRRAFDYAFDAHKDARRKTGEPYIEHPVAVAVIVANEIGLGVKTVIAALLHDVVEDTDFSYDDIKEMFGKTVADTVDGVTKVTNVYNAAANAQAETFKKMLLSIPQNPRVVFVKLADRVHNMRTMDGMPDRTQQIKANENLYVYISIAELLGLYDIFHELQDHSFKVVQPNHYKTVSDIIKNAAPVRNRILADFKMSLMRILVQTEITFKIDTIYKSLYQIWNHLNTGRILEDYSPDAVRIVFQYPEGCDPRKVFRMHHDIYAAIRYEYHVREGSERDYLTTPKSNGFSAIVFQVNYEGHWIEVQIMTYDNEMVAHKGFSTTIAHRKGLETLKKKLGELDSSANAEELVARLRDYTQTQTIYIFTPKGDIKELPVGSTVLDFAYSLGPEFGNHCVGAYVNSSFVPLNHKLRTTDNVNILTSPSAHPHTWWREYVKSYKAQDELTTYFNRDDTNGIGSIELGRIAFTHLMHKLHINGNIVLLNYLIKHYKLSSGDEFYTKLANQEISIDDLKANTERIYLVLKDARRDPGRTSERLAPPVGGYKIDYRNPFVVRRDVVCVYPTCCQPIRGDNAFAFLDDDNLLYIHRRECETAQQHVALHGKQTTRVEWADDLDPMIAAIKVQGTDRQGLIRDLTILLDSWRINIKSLNIFEYDHIFTGFVKMYVKDVAQLDKMMSQVAQLANVVRLSRINPNKISELPTDV